jgi:hypothetical protein
MTKALPKNTAELLAEIESEWQELMRVVDRLTPEQMTRPDDGGWSPKDNLAHLAEWMRIMKSSYLGNVPAAEAMGIDEERLKQLDEDGENAVLFERNRGRTVPDVVDGLKATYAEVLKTLRGMSFADLMKPLRASGPDKRLVIESVRGNTSEHFREHRQVLERSMERP